MSKKWLVILLTVIGILSVLVFISPALASSKPGPSPTESTAQYDISKSAGNNDLVPVNSVMSDSRSGTNKIVPFDMASTTYKMYLSLDQIPGESTAPSNTGWIDVLSFNWGLENATKPATNLGHQAGRVDVHDFSFSHLVDKASPKIMQSCVSAKNIKTGTLEVWRGSNRVYALIMSEIMVSSVNLTGSSSVEQTTQTTAKPLEDVVLNLAKAQWKYWTYKPDGSQDSVSDIQYDQRQSR